MMNGANPGLIGEQNAGADPLGLLGDGRELLLLPALDQKRIALAGEIQRSLRSEAEASHQSPDRGAREANLETLLDQRANQCQRPQRKLEALVLAGSGRAPQQ
jgi:hypothetical protein